MERGSLMVILLQVVFCICVNLKGVLYVSS